MHQESEQYNIRPKFTKEEIMQKLTIAIIDDSPVMSRFLAIFFEKKYQVVTFSDSSEALEAIKKGLIPDAILTDLDMPKLNGIEFIHSVRDMNMFMPIAVLSGSKESALRIKCLESGADEFLSKPFHPVELDMRITNLLRKSLSTEIKEKEHGEKFVPIHSIFRQFIKAAAF